MNFAVLQFPGSNCDQDVVHVLRHVLGHSARFLWHKEHSLGESDAVIIPGGFSYGDYLRTGAIARFSPVMEAVQVFAANGGLVLGVCNGFQILCEAGLLPGALIRANNQILWRYVDARGEATETANPNGSLDNIAGICNEARNVAGLMPHPERASEAILGSADGRLVFDSLIHACQSKLLATAA